MSNIMNRLTHLFQFILLSLILVVSAATLYLLYFTENKDDDANERFMEEMYIQDNIALATSCNGLPFKLKELNTDLPKVICYYSAQSCGKCIDYAKTRIKDVFPNADKDSTVLYVVTNYRENETFKEKNVINIGRKKLDLLVDDANLVCYFVAYKGIVENLFIPEKNYERYTDTYLEQIRKRYFLK